MWCFWCNVGSADVLSCWCSAFIVMSKMLVQHFKNKMIGQESRSWFSLHLQFSSIAITIYCQLQNKTTLLWCTYSELMLLILTVTLFSFHSCQLGCWFGAWRETPSTRCDPSDRAVSDRGQSFHPPLPGSAAALPNDHQGRPGRGALLGRRAVRATGRFHQGLRRGQGWPQVPGEHLSRPERHPHLWAVGGL